MRKKIFGLALSTMLFALSFPVGAQEPAKVPKIGFLGARPASDGVFGREHGTFHFVKLGKFICQSA